MARPIIIDTDPGADDAVAIMLALASPEVAVLGLTVTGGNARLAHTLRNALRLVAATGRSGVPVARGSARALRGGFVHAYHFHGRGGMPVRLPPTAVAPVPEPAWEYTYQRLRERPGQVTLVAVGPLSNVARLLRRYPDARRLLGGLIVMGGAVRSKGNVTPHAEFNVYADPLAAQEVLGSGVPLTLVGLDATRQATLSRGEVRRWQPRTAYGRLARRVLEGHFRTRPERDAFELHDPLAVAAAVDPQVVQTVEGNVTVALEGEERGRTVLREGSGPVRAAVGVDQARLRAILDRL